MTEAERKQLQITACKVRMGVIQGVYSAKSGHPPGGSLSASDLFTYLYFKEMRVDPKNPKADNRDRFVLSKGPHCPRTLFHPGPEGLLPRGGTVHPAPHRQPAAGPPQYEYRSRRRYVHRLLGQGVSTACGMALGAKMRGH